MASRFTGEKKKNKTQLTIVIQIVVFFAAFFLFLYGVRMLAAKSEEYQEESLKKALLQDIVYCYAQDGRYPESLDYIKKTCGLTYNEELFYVDYRTYGNNILPDYTVIRIEEEEN